MAKNKKEPLIKVEGVTKDYGRGRGIFNISFEIPKGCVFGYCGTNGAGKTTTIRNIMGFIKPDKGKITVAGMDAWKDSEKIKPLIGYLPGEIAFPDVKDGTEFLNIQAELTGLKDMTKAEKIINAMQLDPTANIRRMSKGMKQKTAIVAAMMKDYPILILDEPTIGLDPLMRAAFVDLILEEKKRGATILMSNHMFDELQDTCDYVAFIKDGRLIDVVDLSKLGERGFREYKVGFQTKADMDSVKFDKGKLLNTDYTKMQLIIRVKDDETAWMFNELKKHEIVYISEIQHTLEKYFMELMEKKGESNARSKKGKARKARKK